MAAVPAERTESRSFMLRGHKVMLSPDLADLYEVRPKALVQAVKRNLQRFPADFMFQLSPGEFENLKSQIVTSSWGGLRRAAPYAFTEQGVAMLSSVLRSKRAVLVNVEIMRFRAPAADARRSRRSRPQARRLGEEIRRSVQGRIRDHPRAYDPAAGKEAPDRVHFVA